MFLALALCSNIIWSRACSVGHFPTLHLHYKLATSESISERLFPALHLYCKLATSESSLFWQGKTLASVLNGYACAEDSEPLCNTDAYVDCVDLFELATGQKSVPLHQTTEVYSMRGFLGWKSFGVTGLNFKAF